jgi:hypothetical protein
MSDDSNLSDLASIVSSSSTDAPSACGDGQVYAASGEVITLGQKPGSTQSISANDIQKR